MLLAGIDETIVSEREATAARRHESDGVVGREQLVEDVGTFTSPETTNSRASDDDTGQVEDEAEEKHVETSYCDSSLAIDVYCIQLQAQLLTHVHTSLA